jgi:hypothetical protein
MHRVAAAVYTTLTSKLLVSQILLITLQGFTWLEMGRGNVWDSYRNLCHAVFPVILVPIGSIIDTEL